jgi:hypothetical protein
MRAVGSVHVVADPPVVAENQSLEALKLVVSLPFRLPWGSRVDEDRVGAIEATPSETVYAMNSGLRSKVTYLGVPYARARRSTDLTSRRLRSA